MQEVKNPLVGIITGSASDKPIVDKVTGILDEFGVAWNTTYFRRIALRIKRRSMREKPNPEA